MRYFWVIKTIDNECSSSYKYITDTLADAEAHRMDYCGWYCQRGDVDIVRIDENFREVEVIHYWRGEVWEHCLRSGRGVKRIVDKGEKVG